MANQHAEELTPDQIATIITAVLGPLNDPTHHYPSELPTDLAPWYCYPVDSGHCLLVLPASVWATAPADAQPTDYLTPAPVRAVLRVSYDLTGGGYLLVNLPYDPNLGLLTEPDDEEY